MRTPRVATLAGRCEPNGGVACREGARRCFASLVLAGHAQRVHVHGEVGVVVDVALLGGFAEDGEGAAGGERGVEEDGDLAVRRAGEDLVEFGVPVDCDERRTWCDRSDELWTERRWVEDVQVAGF